MRSIVRRDTGDAYEAWLTRLAEASGIATPTRAALARFDRTRKKKGSNNDWTHPDDPDAKITKMKDGRTHLAHKAEQAVDLETGAIVGVTVQDADDGDTTTMIETLITAAEQVAAVLPAEAGLAEVVADKGYHSNETMARRADLLITDSEFSSQEIQAAYGIEASRIAVVPLGVGPPFVPAAPAENGNPAGSDSPYVIHVGDLHPRRNLHTALRAVLSVRQSTSALSRLRLILVGVDRGSAAQLEELVGSAGQRDSLVFKNAVSDEELAELYRSALALVYPSRYEGFGLPLVEAMACGTPVVASNAGSIPEVVGSASRLLDPDDVDGFAAAISGIATDAGLRARLRDASLERASRFSWQRVARDTIEVYRRVARV